MPARSIRIAVAGERACERGDRFVEASELQQHLAVVLLDHGVRAELIGRFVKIGFGEIELVRLVVRPAEAVEIRAVLRFELEGARYEPDRFVQADLPTLGEFYERERRWPEAAQAYGKAMQRAPRNTDLRTRYGQALLNAGGRENADKAKDALSGATDARGMYLLSQAQRRVGDAAAAEATARKVIAQNSKSPWGYYALAESLEERHQFQAVVDELAAGRCGEPR